MRSGPNSKSEFQKAEAQPASGDFRQDKVIGDAQASVDLRVTI
jgi:hypothetical protein